MTDLDADVASERQLRGFGSGRPSQPRLVVEGLIEEKATVARWGPGGTEAEPEVIKRAEIIAALGESAEVGGRRVQAALDCDLPAAAIALMRALSRVTAVELVVGDPHT